MNELLPQTPSRGGERRAETGHDEHDPSALYRTLFEHLGEAVLILDQQALTVDANPAAGVLLSTPVEQLIGQYFRAQSHRQTWRTLDGSEDMVARLLRGERFTGVMAEGPDRTGRLRRFRGSGAPVPLPDGTVGAVLVLQDLTAELEAERDRELASIRMTSAFGRLDHAVHVFRPTLVDGEVIDATVSYLNPSAVTMCRTGTAVGVQASDHHDRDGLLQRIRRAWAGETQRYTLGALGNPHRDLWSEVVEVSLTRAGDELIAVASDRTEEARAAQQLVDSRQLLQATLDTLDEAVIVFGTDGRTLVVNAATGPLLDLDGDLLQIRAGEGDFTVYDLDGNLLRGETLPGSLTLRTRQPHSQTVWRYRDDNTRQWFEVTAAPVAEDPGSPVVVALRDVTEGHELSQALAHSEQRHRNTLHHLPDPVLELEPTLDDGEVVGLDLTYANPAAHHLAVDTWVDLLVPAARRAWQGGRDETRTFAREGRDWQLKLSKAGPLLVAVARDVTETNREVEAVRRIASFDPRTGLASRPHLEQQLDSCLHRGGSVAVLVVRLPWLDAQRARYGFSVADQIVACIARRLAQWADSAQCLACRVDDSSFAVLLDPVTSISEARNRAEDLVSELTDEVQADGVRMAVAAAVGVAVAPLHGETADAVLRRAGAASATAVEDSQTVQIWQPLVSSPAQDRFALLGRLGLAIDNGELRLEYHPRFTPADGAFRGFEARVVWDHPQRGRLAETAFLPHLVGSPQLGAYTRWAVTRAVQDTFPIIDGVGRVGVNLPAVVGASDELVRWVTDGLLDAGTGGHTLAVELAERGTGTSVSPMTEHLQALRDLKVAVHLDDFGVGCSGLATLGRLPLDAIILDRSLARDVARDRLEQRIVAACVDVAHTAGVSVIAAGVETQAAHDTFAAFGCDTVQGFWYSRPINASSLTAGWSPPRAELRRPFSER